MSGRHDLCLDLYAHQLSQFVRCEWAETPSYSPRSPVFKQKTLGLQDIVVMNGTRDLCLDLHAHQFIQCVRCEWAETLAIALMCPFHCALCIFTVGEQIAFVPHRAASASCAHDGGFDIRNSVTCSEIMRHSQI